MTTEKLKLDWRDLYSDLDKDELKHNCHIYTAMAMLMAQEIVRHRGRGSDQTVIDEYYQRVHDDYEIIGE